MNTVNLHQSLQLLRINSEKLSQKLTDVSHDIKWLESELQQYGPPLEFTYEAPGSQELTPEENNLFHQRKVPGWNFLHAKVTERLQWTRDRSCNRFRIIYTRLLVEDRVSHGGHADDGEITTVPFGGNSIPDGVSLRKPLIECSAEVRTRMASSLPIFIAELNRAILTAIEGTNV